MNNSNTSQTSGQQIVQRNLKRKKRKKIIKYILIILIVIAVLFFILKKAGIIGKSNVVVDRSLMTYTVSNRSITQILTSSGTIEPNDQYTINALVNGEIIADYFEEGDTVTEDQLLYRINSENLDSSVTRAENSLKNANKALNDALEDLEKLDVESEYTGTITKLHVEEGDEVNSGALIAEIIDDETMCIDIPFMDVDCKGIRVGDNAVLTFDNYEEAEGTVSEISATTTVNSLGVKVRNITINVKNTGSITTNTRAYAQIGDSYCTADGVFYNNEEGQIFAKTAGEVSKIYYDEGEKIYDGNIIVRLESEDLEEQIDKLRDNVTEAEEALDDANDAFDNYNIEAPITGKVISKNYKTGDTLSGGQGSSSTLAVIYDMSALKFSMNIDELDIDKLDEGQDVIITCDSREGEEYHGTITNISIQGSTSSGTTVYPVEVTIENTEDLNKRSVDADGTVNKIYKTGMTATENTYSLVSIERTDDATCYIYGEDIIIKKTLDGDLYDGDKLLNTYLGGTYTQGSNFYTFSDNFNSLTLEVQNQKKMLRPGMNIDAQIILEKRENVIAVPLSAVGRGNVVKVIKSTSSAENDVNAVNTEKESSGKQAFNLPVEMPERLPENTSTYSSENNKTFGTDGIRSEKTNMPGKTNQNTTQNNKSEYGTADIDTEYVEVRVTVGISDDDYVEILSGLNIGDVVILDTANLASGVQNMQFGMMGGGMMGGMTGGPVMGGGGMHSGFSGGPMGR